MTNAYQVIPAPLASPPRQGLLASAVRPDVAGRRWEGGIVFHPEASLGAGLEDGGAWWDGCLSGGDVTVPGTDKTDGPTCLADVDYLPWYVVEAQARPATSFGPDEYQAIATRRLVANESIKAEAEFWSGTVAQASGSGNNYLQIAGTPVLGTGSIASALAAAQQYLADTIPGRGMIHARPYVVSLWRSAHMVEQSGNLLLDVFGNIIVAGQGYDGNAPTGTATDPFVLEAIYATGLVQYLSGPVENVGSYQEDLDRDTNLVTVRAERLTATFHDEQAQACVLVDLTDACPSYTINI